MSTNSKLIVQELLSSAGIKINGDNPWDIHIHDERTFNRILRDGSLGLGESYMDGWWDCDAIDQFINRITGAGLREKASKNWKVAVYALTSILANEGRRSNAYSIGEKHYDAGNDIFGAMLDRRLVYTSAYWSGNPPAKNLDDAQEAKLDLVCRKLGVKPGHRVLDIGCGWGSFAKFAAAKYGVTVVGITVSKEQAELGQELCKELPVEIHLQDYREINGKFDHVVSLGMFEHVGYKNYKTYMRIVHDCLKDNGLFLLHTIGGNKTSYAGDPWMHKHIFPVGMIPSIQQIGKAIEGLFVMEDWHNFGADYDKTLMAWFHNFDSRWQQLKDKYSDRFYRMWKYYLLICAGTFRARHAQLWQIVLSKKGVIGGWGAVR